MTINHYKGDLKVLIEEDKIKQVISVLKKDISKHSKFYNILILICRNFNEISVQLLSNIEDPSKISLDFNKIAYRLLEIIDQLDDEHIQSYSTIPQNILNPILVVTFSEKTKAEMETFFLPLDTLNVKVRWIQSSEFQWNEKYDLTIWDNRDLPYCAKKDDMDKLKERELAVVLSRLPLLEKCLSEASSPHFIHFGEPFFLVSENRNRVNAANSFYTLFGRIRETIDYINTCQV